MVMIARVTLLVGRTLRIRRRRAQDVADTTDSLRAVACIRFVRPGLSVQGARLWGNLMWAMACRGGVERGNPMWVLREMED